MIEKSTGKQVYIFPMTMEELEIMNAMLEVVADGGPYMPLTTYAPQHQKLFQKSGIVLNFARAMEKLNGQRDPDL